MAVVWDLRAVSPRPETRRQSDSARRYLDQEATTPALRNTVELAARSLGFGIAQLNILDESTQYTLVNVGGAPVSTVERSSTLCDDVVRTGTMSIFARNRHDATVRQRGLIEENGLMSYASVPLRGREGLVIGTLCLLDHRPRDVTDNQVLELEQYASVLEEQLDLHRRVGSGSTKLGDQDDLPHALASGHIVPWFQPIVALRTGDTIGFEALARWHHPIRGLVAPADFVPYAESSELIIDVDLSVFRQAVAELQVWKKTRPDVRLSANLSGKHLAHPDFVNQLMQAMDGSSIVPTDVTLELTETTAVTPGPLLQRHIEDVHALGFGVLLDDFGSGWSSLERLMTLSPDGIKIDGRLTRSIDTTVGRAILRGLVTIAEDLGLILVVEGIESREQADIATELGCTLAQGFLWSRPQSAAAIRRTLS